MTSSFLPDAYLRIWKEVKKIPRGKVATYGVVAERCGLPRRARLVGHALRALPEGIDVPWQRVINAAGRISVRNRRDSVELQAVLLTREGVTLKHGKIDLKKFGWPVKRYR